MNKLKDTITLVWFHKVCFLLPVLSSVFEVDLAMHNPLPNVSSYFCSFAASRLQKSKSINCYWQNPSLHSTKEIVEKEWKWWAGTLGVVQRVAITAVKLNLISVIDRIRPTKRPDQLDIHYRELEERERKRRFNWDFQSNTRLEKVRCSLRDYRFKWVECRSKPITAHRRK